MPNTATDKAEWFRNALKNERYADCFSEEAIELATKPVYPREAIRLESRFCREMQQSGGDMCFADLVQFAPRGTVKEQARLLKVASNLCLLK